MIAPANAVALVQMIADAADTPSAEEAANENARLQVLDDLDILETPREEAFDRIARLVGRVFEVPIALVSFIDGHRQWFKASVGLVGPEAPRGFTFCQHVVAEGGALAVPDALADERFNTNPFVVGSPNVRFYVGVPLADREGHSIGTLCIIDTKPRPAKPEMIAMLADFAHLIVDELELRRLASADALTGTASRRALVDAAQRAAALAMRDHRPLSWIAVDLDFFKAINDRFGHSGGDAVLRGAAKVFQAELRDSDLLGRMGGEEFGVLVPGADVDKGLELAERLKRRLASHQFHLDGERVSVTASFGVAALGPAIRDTDELVRRADEALREAKRTGRDRCVGWRPPAGEPVLNLRRVLKRGSIMFNGGASAMDCTVRGLSGDGARLEVSSALGVPNEFELRVAADRLIKACQVVSRAARQIEVTFA